MKNYIEIGGIDFEIKKGYMGVSSLQRYSGRTLYQCYERPSITKQSIYDEWRIWACDNDIEYFGVSGYNSNCFTLQGLAHVNEKDYILRITKAHNYAYEF